MNVLSQNQTETNIDSIAFAQPSAIFEESSSLSKSNENQLRLQTLASEGSDIIFDSKTPPETHISPFEA